MSTTDQALHARLTLGPDDHGRLVSSQEFAEADFEEPWKYEREDGRLIVMPPDGQTHNEGSRPWRRLLAAYWIEHPDLVEDVVPNAWVRIDDDKDRIGDIGIYLKVDEPVPPIPDRVPEMMFEIVSPGRASRERDYVKKRANYHRLGVREYVVVDRYTRRVTVFTHAAEGYEERVLNAGDVYSSPFLPGLVVPLDETL